MSLTGLAAPEEAHSPKPREFPIGFLRTLDDLPESRLKSDLKRSPGSRQDRALKWLQSWHFTEADLPSLYSDSAGGVFYVCDGDSDGGNSVSESQGSGELLNSNETFVTSQVAVPVSPFPPNLFFHSRPGAPNILYINFCGETVSNTAWNTDLGRTEIPAVAFSTDADLTTFSDSEQLAIKRIWQRMSEDYAPFNIDVTTERPAALNSRTAVALITRTTDANGAPNPQNSAGGVAYVNTFGTSSYATYRPAWIYQGNLANNEGYIAEAASHEIGHNMGLSHDGKTDGSAYYGGHGSGDTSWGPLMGTGYNRNVSQWCKGDYYLANNTQDDLATIAGKITYRADDHGSTAGTATALMISGGTNIVSTTPENDPANTNTFNKGVLERSTDLDGFSFITGNGSVSLAVNPLIMPSGTRGGNSDISIELYNDGGALLLSNNPSATTCASIQTNLAEGKYYLYIRGVGTGDPYSATPSGYTSYASVGQYFVSGYITAPVVFVAPPVAELAAADISYHSQAMHQVVVSYSDNVSVDVSTIGADDIRITGPNGYDQMAQSVTLDTNSNGALRVATYLIAPPDGSVWSRADNGSYTVWMRTNQVGDVEGAWVPAGQLGTFQVNVPVIIYAANMDTDPGWILDPQWAYGVPAYSGAGPSAGFTGSKIVGYDLSGNYADRLSAKYATTPAFNCSGITSASVRFKRWLRTRSNDLVSVQFSTDATTWSDLWFSSAAVSDTSWQQVEYTLPVTGIVSAVRLRWTLSSNNSLNEIGWNIDDVEVLGQGSLDTDAPAALLNITDINQAGAMNHSFTVSYTDATAVRLASLGSSDLVVFGPDGHSNSVVFVGMDLPGDGSPVNATYSLPAPGGLWDYTDNGTYTLVLVANEVEDTYGNQAKTLTLGNFVVSIPDQRPPTATLAINVNNTNWGSVNPGTGAFALGTSVQLLAVPSQYYRFVQWTGDLSGTNETASLALDSDKIVGAVFAEITTVNNPTPYAWLAAFGITNDLENVVTQIGVNGMPVWQSYVAGLNPNDPQSQFRAAVQPCEASDTHVLHWNTVSNRVYTIWSATNFLGVFEPIQNAQGLPWTETSFTNAVMDSAPRFYRIQVELEH